MSHHDNPRRKTKRAKLYPLPLKTTGDVFDLPSELQLEIFHYLTEQDFVIISECSKGCYEQCKAEQMPVAATRFTIDMRKRQGVDYFLTGRDSRCIMALLKFLEVGWERGVFHPNSRLKRMKLIHHGGLPVVQNKSVASQLKRLRLLSITGLDLSFSPLLRSRAKRKVAACLQRFLAQLLLNLSEIDLSHNDSSGSSVIYFAKNCHKLKKVTTNGTSTTHLNGYEYRDSTSITDIHMENMDLRYFLPLGMNHQMFSKDNDSSHSLSLLLSNVEERVENVSVVNCTFTGNDDERTFYVTQAMLMKFVRKAKKLRWFRSNLTPENIVILKKERPDVEFISVESFSGVLMA